MMVFIFLQCTWLFFPVDTTNPTPSESRFELLSAQLFNGAEYIALVNDTAYCAFNPGLVIIDFSDPSNPILISETFLNSRPYEIHLLGETAIMLAPYKGLIMVDVSDVQKPRIIGEFLDFPNPISMTLKDSTGLILYQTDQMEIDGLASLALSDPVEPRVLNSIEMEADFEQIAIQENRAFVAANREGVMIFDIERPDSLELVFQYDPFTTQYVRHCVVRDSLIYVGVNHYIQILSMTPGDSLVLLGQVSSGIDFRAMALVQDYIYVSGFQIIDVSDPTHPVSVENFGLSHSASQYLLQDDILYVPNRGEGVEVWDVEAPTDPVMLGTYEDFYMSAIDVDTDHAYMTRWGDGLYIYSISDPRNPQLEGYFNPEVPLEDVLVRDDIAYLAAWTEGLIILDVSNPCQPQWIAQYKDSTSWIHGLAMRDSLIFSAEHRNGIKIIDVSDPYRPALITTFVPSMIDDAMNIVLGGDFAYIANYRGIIAVDISDIQNPIEVAIFDNDENRKMDVAYHNNKIYYNDYHRAAFYIRDVTDPYNSNLLYWDWFGNIIGYDYFMNYPVLFSADGFLSAIDISDSQNPMILEQFPSHQSRDLAGDDLLVYSVGNSFVILDFDRGGLGNDDEASSETPPIPETFSLSQNYPNPFNPSTTIKYEIPAGKGSLLVKITIYDIRGRLVKKLVDDEKEPGRYQVHWDGKDDRGIQVSSGVYMYRIEAGKFVSTRKMVMLE
jgi:hypothetical protein